MTRSQLDLSHPSSIPATLDAIAPDAVINCAAYTKVDRAETEEGLATTINSEAVGVMADWAVRRDRPFLTFSTDYVFPGDATEPYVESSPTDPINAYGRSKLAGEHRTVAARGLVIRTSWIISGSHPNFVATILGMAREREVSVVDDQQGCPTFSHDLAATSLEALESRVVGLLHVTNQGAATWYELARAAIVEAGLDPGRISSCSTAEYPTEARRPAYSVLGSERLEKSGLSPPPPWRQSLPSVVAELKTWV